MLICRDRLSIADITDYWSREIQPFTLPEQLVDVLEAAWWRREVKTDGPLTPLALLKSMFKSAHEGYLTSLVFVTKDDAEGVELPGGGLLVDPSRPTIPVPSDAPETWSEASCDPAFNALAKLPSRKHYRDRTIQFLMMEIHHEQFVNFLRAYSLDVPKFWRASIQGSLELQEKGPSSRDGRSSNKQEAQPSPTVRRPGRKPIKFNQTKQEMMRDIQEGRLSMAFLKAMLEKELAQRYRVSRDTVRRARDVVLSEIVEKSNPDK
jgi:hypothetical protein